MIGDGIFHGDKVLLRPNVKPKNGEIAAVQYSNQYLATLKHVYFSPNQEEVILRASNDEYPDTVISGRELQVAGVYRGLIRTN